MLFFVLSPSLLGGQKERSPSAKQAQIKVLVLSPLEHRSKAYQELFQQHGLVCDVVGYEKVSAKDMETHGVIVLDSTDATFDQYKQWSKIDFKALPKTDKPIIAMGYYGYFYLHQYEIALGKVKT
jgi:hypothetical protein